MANWEDEPNPLGPPTGIAPTPLDAANLQAGEDRAVSRANAYTDAANPSISGGDAAPSMGRTSTTRAPALSTVYVVTTAPGATASNGNGTTDDTSVIQTAGNAVNAVGGGSVILPPFNPLSTSGTRAMWTFQRFLITGYSNVRIYGYGAQAQFVSTSNGGSMFKGDGSSLNPGAYQVNGFALEGLTIVGTGNEGALQSVVGIDRGSDITLRDVTVTLWNGAVFNLYDVQRTRVRDSTLLNCTHGGANPINISAQNSFGGWTVQANDIIVTGNIVTGNTAPVAVSTGSPAPSSTLLLSTIWFQGNPPTGVAPTGGGTDVSFMQKNFFNGVVNSGSTSVTAISPAQPVGLVYSVTGLNIPASTTLTITGTGTTGTLSHAATGGASTTIVFTQTATFSTTGVAIPNFATAAQVQTALQAAITAGGGPASAVTCYGGPLGQSWNGNTPPSPPVWIVFNANMPGVMVNLTTTDAYVGGTVPQTVFAYPQLRLIVTGNILESNSLAALDLEIGGAAAGGGISAQVYHDVLLSGNHLSFTGSMSSSDAALVLSNDTNPLIARGDLFRRVVIVGNNIQSNSDGAILNGYDISWQANTVKAARYGIKVQPSAGGPNATSVNSWSNSEALANPNSNVHIKGGSIRMTDSTASSAAISFNGVVDSSIDIPIYWDTGTKGTSEGIFLQNCTGIDVRASVKNAPMRALRMTSCGDIRISGDALIRNASSATGQNVEAVRIDGTLVGDITFNPGVSIVDLRGTPTHKYGIDAASATLSGHAVRLLQPVTITGYTIGQTNGTITLVGGGAGNLQTNVVRTSTNYQMQAADLMVIMTVSGLTVTLPLGLTSAYQTCGYIVKNGAAGAGTVATGTTGLIEHNISGVTAATSEPIPGGIGQANTYVPDSDLVSAAPNYDWAKA